MKPPITSPENRGVNGTGASRKARTAAGRLAWTKALIAERLPINRIAQVQHRTIAELAIYCQQHGLHPEPAEKRKAGARPKINHDFTKACVLLREARKTNPQISREMGCSLDTVKRALRLLREAAAEDQISESPAALAEPSGGAPDDRPGDAAAFHSEPITDRLVLSLMHGKGLSREEAIANARAYRLDKARKAESVPALPASIRKSSTPYRIGQSLHAPNLAGASQTCTHPRGSDAAP